MTPTVLSGIALLAGAGSIAFFNWRNGVDKAKTDQISNLRGELSDVKSVNEEHEKRITSLETENRGLKEQVTTLGQLQLERMTAAMEKMVSAQQQLALGQADLLKLISDAGVLPAQRGKE